MTIKEQTNNFNYIAERASKEIEDLLNNQNIKIINTSFYEADLFINNEHIAKVKSDGEHPFDKPNIEVIKNICADNRQYKIFDILGRVLNCYQLMHYAYNLEPKKNAI